MNGGAGPRIQPLDRRSLMLIAGAALVVRVTYTLLVARHDPLSFDARTFRSLAQGILDGSGYTAATPGPGTIGGPTAVYPPLFPLLLAALDGLGLGGPTEQRIALGVLGAGTAVAIAYAGAAFVGPRAGMVAGLTAAIYPPLWLADASLMTESLFGFLMALALLATVLLARDPTPASAAGAGAALGLAAVTRSEALLLVPLVLIPLLVRARVPRRRRLVLATVSLVLALAPAAAWTLRNARIFADPVVVATNASITLGGANCDEVYAGRLLGSWSLDCYGKIPRDLPSGDESQRATAYRERALRYARAHADRLPVVAAARLLRTWDLYRPLQHARIAPSVGRNAAASHLALPGYYVVLCAAVLGGLVARRRALPLLPLAAPVILVCLVSVAGYGMPRFRIAAEPSLVVLAATAVSAVGARAGPSLRLPTTRSA